MKFSHDVIDAVLWRPICPNPVTHRLGNLLLPGSWWWLAWQSYAPRDVHQVWQQNGEGVLLWVSFLVRSDMLLSVLMQRPKLYILIKRGNGDKASAPMRNWWCVEEQIAAGGKRNGGTSLHGVAQQKPPTIKPSKLLWLTCKLLYWEELLVLTKKPHDTWEEREKERATLFSWTFQPLDTDEASKLFTIYTIISIYSHWMKTKTRHEVLLLIMDNSSTLELSHLGAWRHQRVFGHTPSDTKGKQSSLFCLRGRVKISEVRWISIDGRVSLGSLHFSSPPQRVQGANGK